MMMNLSDKRLKRFTGGQSVALVSRELGVAEGILHNWKKSKLETNCFPQSMSGKGNCLQ